MFVCFFCCAEAFCFDVAPIVYFCFCFPCLRRPIYKDVPMTNVKEITAFALFKAKMFLIVVSGITFRSLIYFEFIFVSDVESHSVSFFVCYCPVLPILFIEETVFFPIGYCFLFCGRLIDHIALGSFLDFLFCSVDVCVYFCTSIILF